ncbi:hypothetical protein C1H46_042457 [Malus baccata]|uniref:CRM domain-containing protein n=1 Tax=Malus baccata TaxID=106549 RepID=A0A540KCS0_MALBA|nr:hypothetical protein C1H46_042457 [Malus baccata]
MAITFSSICGEDENGKVDPVSSNEPAISQTVANLFDDVNGEEGVPVSTSVSSNGSSCSATVGKQRCISGNSESDRRSQYWQERILTRSPRRNNIVAGVAKTIKQHFEKHPLAIVNVKGIAKGTGLGSGFQTRGLHAQQATGAVLVSHEPSKVVLYRGWGAGDYPGLNDRNGINTGKKASSQGVVSPEGGNKT